MTDNTSTDITPTDAAGLNDKWRERWYGSDNANLEGWSIVNDRTNDLIVYLGRRVSPEVVLEIVTAHNAVVSTTQAAPILSTQTTASLELSDSQIASACLSFRHDFGLLTETERKMMMFVAREWERAFNKERDFANITKEAGSF